MANVPTTAWAETTPAGSDQINAGDNRIRELKTQIREVIAVDHDFPSSGQATDNGQHLRATLQEQADLGTGAEGTTILGNQTVSGKGELVYTDEDDNDIQMTILGTPIAINACTAKTEPIDDDLLLLCDSEDSYKSKKLTLANLMNVIYPVGSVVTLGVSTNPSTLFGVGTWTAIVGKVIVGIDGTQTEFDTLNETGGAKTVTLDTTMMPAHNHAITYNGKGIDFYGGGSNVNAADDSLSNGGNTLVTSANTGDGLAHNNLQPYIVKYCWERTA